MIPNEVAALVATTLRRLWKLHPDEQRKYADEAAALIEQQARDLKASDDLARIQEAVISNLRAELKEESEQLAHFMRERNRLADEVAEQCRLNGMGSEREARLMARVAELEREVERLRAALGK